MSLRWRIMGLTVLVVVLTALISVAVGYFTTQSRLDVFVDQLGEEEAIQLARDLSREYTAAGGWDTVDRALSEAGYSQGQAPRAGRQGESEEQHVEALHEDPVRVVVTDLEGRVIRDNFRELAPGAPAPNLRGHREPVVDLGTNQPVGYVHVDVNQEFLASESGGFLNTLLTITLVGGVLTAVVAILLAMWVARRITAPVSALTEATHAIAQGETARLPVTSSDELGRMSEAFNRMTTALETQRELRRRLVSDVSHELNTPLSVIQLEATGLRDELQSPEDASEHIIDEVERLRGLVSDLNSLVETDYGELQLTLQTSSVRDLLAAEVDRWRSQARAREVDVSLQVGTDLPDVDLDPMRMSQAVGNVLRNAIHAAEPGGNVVLGAETEGEGTVAISVVDDGIGIDAEELPRVFDRFYRTDRSRSRGIGGTGLGLAITRAIVEAHGGTVTVASAGPGEGATVTVRLPVGERASPGGRAG